jgi:hypothetical protein
MVPDLSAFQLFHDDIFDPNSIVSCSRVRIYFWDRYVVRSQKVHRCHLASHCKGLWSRGRVGNADNELRAVTHRDLEDSVEAAFCKFLE